MLICCLVSEAGKFHFHLPLGTLIPCSLPSFQRNARSPVYLNLALDIKDKRFLAKVGVEYLALCLEADGGVEVGGEIWNSDSFLITRKAKNIVAKPCVFIETDKHRVTD